MHLIWPRLKSNIVKSAPQDDELVMWVPNSHIPLSSLNAWGRAPREKCQSFHSSSGPKFALPALRDTIPILRENLPVAQLERALTEANIENAQSDGLLLDQEILNQQRSLEKLQNRRKALRRFEELERAVLSPIRRVPVEVLRHIFVLANTGESLYDRDIKSSPRVTIPQVSVYWRSVAHSCALLWANINVAKIRHPTYVQHLEDCIRFSQRMPLTLKFGLFVKPVVIGLNFMNALGQNAYRWEDLTVFEGELAVALFASIPKDMSLDRLESLQMHELPIGVFISSAPKLRHLSFSGHHFNCPQITINFAPSLEYIMALRVSHASKSLRNLDLSHTTHFLLDNVELQPNEIINILKCMPKLNTFTCHGPGTTGTCTRSIQLPCLETMTLDCLTAGNILDQLEAPNLENLFIGNRYESSSVQQLARRSKCALDKLKIGAAGIDETFLIPEFASVKSLYWNHPRDIEKSIAWLAYQSKPSPEVVFSGLENLSIIYLYPPTSDDWWDVADLIHMLKSRIRPQEFHSTERSYLKSVRLNITFKGKEARLLTKFVQSEFVRRAGVMIDIWRDGELQSTTSEEWSKSFR